MIIFCGGTISYCFCSSLPPLDILSNLFFVLGEINSPLKSDSIASLLYELLVVAGTERKITLPNYPAEFSI